MGIEKLQTHLTNDLLVIRKPYFARAESFRYNGRNVVLGNITEDRFRVGSFDEIRNHRFGGILGGAQPSDYSASIELWNAYFKQVGRDALFFGFDLTPDKSGGTIKETQPRVDSFLKDALEQDEVYDITVTDPFKRVALNYLKSIGSEISKNALDIGVVNHIIRGRNGKIYGLNTDGIGMVKAIQERISLEDSKVLVIGAGGSAAAITYELLGAGLKELVILNRTESKAVGLAERWQKIYGRHVIAGGLSSIDDHLEDADIILQAVTQGGMTEEQARGTKSTALFVDTRYGPKADFIDLGKRVERATEDGRGMLYWQFVEALRHVEEKAFGVKVDDEKLKLVRGEFGYGK